MTDIPAISTETGLSNPSAGPTELDQRKLADIRSKTWPHPAPEIASLQCAELYVAARVHGIPNEVGARVPIKTGLNLDQWQKAATGHSDDTIVLSGITYGFSLQYLGPPLSELDIEMHTSAQKYTTQVQDYFDVKSGHGAIAGPFASPPFSPWVRTSPLMTRPKADAHRRRVIVDLSYPHGRSVNQYVIKNNYYGQYINHTLPRIDDVIQAVAESNYDVMLATIDIKRAYRNFPGCPLDYPLNTIKFQGKYYIDLAMPFGACTSSTYMQKIAEFISRALQKSGIPTHIYLDDVILYFCPGHDPSARMREAVAFMKALGLPLAEEKMQNPEYRVLYLGIWLDVLVRRITMPEQKIHKFLDLVTWMLQQESVSKKIVQSSIGKVIHFTACVPAARTFINRILSALRDSHNETVVFVNQGMAADLRWFKRFLKKYNGISVMKDTAPEFTIEADACLTGGGATDFNHYLAYEFPPNMTDMHISILEAVNCLAACRSFMTKEKHSKTVLIKCDNIAAMESFTRGSARDNFLAAISRAMWYCIARADIRPIYQYTPGELMFIPDALSRMHTSTAHRRTADTIIHDFNLSYRPFKPYLLDFHDFL